jgi:hypothetical protein
MSRVVGTKNNHPRSRCKYGHELTPENVYSCRIRKGTQLVRRCRQCRAAYLKTWQSSNKAHISRWHKSYRAANKERLEEARLVREYGIGLEKQFAMFQEQKGVCAISGLPPDGRPLVIDHCHETSQPRQLLHHTINSALGLFQHNPEWLRRAADYIEGWRRQHARRTTSGLVEYP